MIARLLSALLLALALPTMAMAQARPPEPSPGDPRNRTEVYTPNQVIALRGHLGYQMLVEFDPNERIENVAIGDSVSWQVTPTRSATMLFIKPVERNTSTNMTVITASRRYNFELSSRAATSPNDPAVIYTVRFVYPEQSGPRILEIPTPPAPERDISAGIENLNFAYRTEGRGRGLNARVFDDGATTFFQFPEDQDAPAIFVVGADGNEELVDQQVRGRYTVVDRIAPRFVLRYGRVRTVIVNEGFSSSPGRGG